MKTEIKKSFQIRDSSVAENNLEAFLNTQENEIPGSGSSGYMGLCALKSEVLSINQDDEYPEFWKVLVKEKYYKNDKYSHQGYLLYTVVLKDEKVRVVNAIF